MPASAAVREKDGTLTPEEAAPPARGILATGMRGQGRRRWLVLGVMLVAVAAGVATWRHFAGRESTDDAQVDGHVNPVAARVAGTVLEVRVHENDHVEQGQVLVRIDPRDYQVAVAKAEADLAEDEALARAMSTSVPVASATTGAQETEAESGVEGAQARLVSAQAELREAEARDRKAAQDLERLAPLLAKDEVSRQEHDAAVAAADSARASREAAAAAVRQAEKAVEAARARLRQAQTGKDQVAIVSARSASQAAKVEQRRAILEQARLNLAYTEIKAPVAGTVSRKSVEVGQVVQAGQPLLALVPLDDLWITANFKETQLASMRPGQRALVTIDAFGGREYRGHVDSISAATGSRFSLLPPENASGNFVKVVQRIPVKIVLEPGQDPERRLRPGMSANPTVLTR